MNTNRILLAGLVAGVFAFFFGWLVFGILFKDMMPAGMGPVMRSEETMVMWAMVASNLIWGIFVAYVFVQWANISTWQTGAMAGAVMGLLISAAFDTGFYSMTTMYTVQDVVIDVAINTFFVAVMGAVTGWWKKKKK